MVLMVKMGHLEKKVIRVTLVKKVILGHLVKMVLMVKMV
jgi:hypothetical protein